MAMSDAPMLVMGYAAPEATEEAKRAMTELAIFIGSAAELDLAVTALPSYDRVTQLVHKGKIDLAWVSPIPYIALSRSGTVKALASPHRGGLHYQGAIITEASALIDGVKALAGKRVAWVDRYSAAGFVVPRIELVKAGLDVKSAFASQRFAGSHEAVVRAVLDGSVDVGATYARVAPNGAVTGGPWSKIPGAEEQLRVLATFGDIPPDVIAARAGLASDVVERLKRALLVIGSSPEGKAVIESVFGADGLMPPHERGYEDLRIGAIAAMQEKLLEIASGEDGEEIEPELVFDPNAEQTLKMKVPPI